MSGQAATDVMAVGADTLVLAYADLPARFGITLERTPHVTRVTIPPRWGLALARLLMSGQEGWQILSKLGRVFEPVVIEASPHALLLRNVVPLNVGRQPPADFTFPRDCLYDVRYVGHSSNLVVRARGHEMLEVRPVRNEKVLRWLAEVLVDALALGRPGADAERVSWTTTA